MTGSSVPEIRLVRPAEHEEAGAVVLSAYHALPGDHSSPGYDLVLRDVARRAQEAEVYVAVAGPPAGGGVLGCVTFVPDMMSPWAEMVEPSESAVRMLAVDPAAQGRGIGRALLERCIARGRELGSAALFLHSTPWMVVAHGLYERSGFVRVPERDWLPVPEVPLLAYRLEL